MQRARIDKTIREMLVGHKTGLDSVYYKASEEEMLLEYSKSINLLSINKETRLKAKIKELEETNNKNEGLIIEYSKDKDETIQMLMRKQEQFELMIQTLIDSGQIKPRTN
jgi:hypothetical protein